MEGAIKSRLTELMHAADWNTVTERQLRNQVAEDLDVEAETYSQLIKDEVLHFLEAKADAADAGEANENKPPSKRKKAAGAAATAARPAKASKVAAGDAEYVLELGSTLRRASVKVYKGKVQVDLREYYEDKATAEVKPSPKGVALSLEQWLLLRPRLQALAKAARAGEVGGEPVRLSADRQAYVSSFKDRCLVHVRELYEKEGELLPGKKGVTLDEGAITALIQHADEITSEAQRRSGGGPSSGPGAATTAASAGPPPARPRAAPSSSVTEAAAKTASGSGSGSAAAAAAAGPVDLGGTKRAAVTSFKGATYVDLREFYNKDGALLPGKKGIFLKPAEFKLVAGNVAAISAAAASQNMQYTLDLGAMRKVGLSEYRGQLYVSVREYYVDAGGEPKPGSKGLSMNLEQWKKLVAGIPGLLQSLGGNS